MQQTLIEHFYIPASLGTEDLETSCLSSGGDGAANQWVPCSVMSAFGEHLLSIRSKGENKTESLPERVAGGAWS